LKQFLCFKLAKDHCEEAYLLNLPVEERCTPVTLLLVGINTSVISKDTNTPLLQQGQYSNEILHNIPEREGVRGKSNQSLIREHTPLESIPANQRSAIAGFLFKTCISSARGK